MSNYRTCRNYENLEKKIYPGVPPLGIPEILPAEFDDSKVKEFRGFKGASKLTPKEKVMVDKALKYWNEYLKSRK